MANNKIVYGDQTLIDLTSDTVTPETLAMGETAHSASGAQIVGTMSPSGPATPLTPSNSSPATIVSGETYEAQSGGVAIASLQNITPSNSSPVSLTSGNIYKMDGNGHAISSYSSVTPSNFFPGILDQDTMFRIINKDGYLVESQPRPCFPSDNGEYFPTGISYMSGTGYAYSGRPTLKPTALWTNSSTSTSSSTEFASQTVTLSQSYANFDYVGIISSHSYAVTSESDWMTTIYPSAQMTKFGDSTTSGVDAILLAEAYLSGSSTRFFIRRVRASSTTSILFGAGLRLITGSSGSTASMNTRLIPRKIVGYKISA